MKTHDRTIDDPGLNQDSTYDKMDQEHFDDSDDFHKYDDTSNEDAHRKENKESSSATLASNSADSEGKFDGTINI